MEKTKSAGGVIAKNLDGKVCVLLLGTSENKYFLPKGHVEGSETLEEAALREVWEESGLKKVKIIMHLGSNTRVTDDKKELKTIHYFLMKTTEVDEKHESTPDNQGLSFEWHDIDNLPEFYLEEQINVIKSNLDLIKSEIE